MHVHYVVVSVRLLAYLSDLAPIVSTSVSPLFSSHKTTPMNRLTSSHLIYTPNSIEHTFIHSQAQLPPAVLAMMRGPSAPITPPTLETTQTLRAPSPQPTMPTLAPQSRPVSIEIVHVYDVVQLRLCSFMKSCSLSRPTCRLHPRALTAGTVLRLCMLMKRCSECCSQYLTSLCWH